MALLSIDGLSVHYYTLSGIVRAVDDVSLNLELGEWVSIVGESGSGKSTLGFSTIRLTPPPGRIVGGSIVFNGVDIVKAPDSVLRKIRGREISMIFQDPMTSLDPLRTVGSQLKEVVEDHGIGRGKEAGEIAKRGLLSVGLPENAFYSYPHQLSGGQRQRVAIAIATVLRPKLLIADEPTTALDVIVQKSIMDLLEDYNRKGMSVLLITHDVALASERSRKIAVMYAGELVEFGDTRSVIEDPLHPYTQLLIRSVPDVVGEKRLTYIPGEPPDLRRPPSGCRFHPRCPFADSMCKVERPKQTVISGRAVLCHYAGTVKVRD